MAQAFPGLKKNTLESETNYKENLKQDSIWRWSFHRVIPLSSKKERSAGPLFLVLCHAMPHFVGALLQVNLAQCSSIAPMSCSPFLSFKGSDLAFGDVLYLHNRFQDKMRASNFEIARR